MPVPFLDLWPRSGVRAAFLTTFTLHASWFEVALVRRLLDAGARTLAVLVDGHAGYQAALACGAGLAAAGRDYYLVPVRWTEGAFHPKVHLFTGPAACALVGSGNLTPGGTGGNLEVFDRLVPLHEGRALRQVRAFFRDLLRHHTLGLSPDERETLLRQLEPAEDPPPVGSAEFLHTLHRPLLDQFSLLDDGYSRALLAAPFHDEKHQTAEALALKLGTLDVAVAVDQHSPPHSADWARQGHLEDERKRRLHAKLVSAVSEQASLLVIGSANLTTPAWRGGNVEAVVVRQELSPGAFNDWIEQVRFVEKRWNEPVKQPESQRPELPPLPLLWATEVDGTLTLAMQAVSVEVTFLVQSNGVAMPLSMSPGQDGHLHVTIPFEVTGPLLLRASAPGHAETMLFVSQPRRLSSQGRLRNLRDTINRIRRGGFEEGLSIELLGALGRAMEVLSRNVPVHSGVESPREGRSEEVDWNDDEGDMYETEELLLGRVPRPGALARNLHELLALFRRAALRGAPDASTAGRWRAEMVEEIAAFELVDERTRDDRPEDAEAHEWEMVTKLCHLLALSAGRARELFSTEDLEEALAVDELVAGVLESFAGSTRGEGRRMLCAQLLEWFRAGWAVSTSPSRAPGCLLAAGEACGDRAVSALPQFLVAVGELMTWGTTLHVDDAYEEGRRVLLGFQRCQPYLALGEGHAELVETLRKLKETRGRWELAQEALAPLWGLDRTNGRVQSLRRSGRRGPELDRAEQELAARLRVDAPLPGIPSMRRLWTEARPRRGSDHKLVSVSEGVTTCPSCQLSLPSEKRELLQDNRRVVACGNCRVLLTSCPEPTL